MWIVFHASEFAVPHAQLAALSPAVAAAMSALVVTIMRRRLTPPELTLPRSVVLISSSALLMLIPQRVESELLIGHGLRSVVLEGHGWSTALAVIVGLAVGAARRLVHISRAIAQS